MISLKNIALIDRNRVYPEVLPVTSLQLADGRAVAIYSRSNVLLIAINSIDTVSGPLDMT